MTETRAPSQGEPPLRRALIIATTTVASSMYSLDLTVVSLALPHMQGTFSATTDEIAWVVTAFIVGATGTITLVGWLMGVLGRRRLFSIAVGIYMVVAVLASFAHTLEEMVVWRFLAGLCGAAIIPVSQVVSVDAYPRELYGRALTLWGVGSVGGSILAPPLAGLVIGAYGWPAVMIMNLPLGALALLGILTVVPHRGQDETRTLDGFGLATLLVGLAAVQLMLNRGARQDWFASPEIVAEAIVGAVCLYLFIAHSATARNPFLRPGPLKNWNYSIGLLSAILYGVLWPLPMVLLPLLLQSFRGLPVDVVGVLMVPRQLGYMVGSMMMIPLIARLNHRLLSVIGFGGLAGTAWMMSAWSLEVSYLSIALAAILQGIACAFAFNAINAMAFATLPPADRQQCVPMFYLSINLGTSLGIAGTVTYWAEETTRVRAALIERISPYNPLLQQPGSSGWDVGTATGRSALEQEIGRQAGMIGFNDTFFEVMIVAIVATLFMFVFKGARRR